MDFGFLYTDPNNKATKLFPSLFSVYLQTILPLFGMSHREGVFLVREKSTIDGCVLNIMNICLNHPLTSELTPQKSEGKKMFTARLLFTNN